MTKFLLPIAINVINKAVDKIPEDLDDLLKKFVVALLKKAAAKSGNKVDDLLVAQLEKALFCLLYTSPSPRDMRRSRMPSSA